MHRKLQEEAKQKIVEEYKVNLVLKLMRCQRLGVKFKYFTWVVLFLAHAQQASKKYHGEMKKIEKILLDRKGLGRKVAAEWKEDYRHWKDVQKLGAAERRQFHKAAKKRVIQRLMRPTLLDTALAALKRFFAKRGKSKGSGKQGVTRVVDDETDLEAGKGEGNEEDDAEVDEDDQRVDVDDEDEYGGNRVPKNRASSSRGSKGLSEAETEAPPNPAPQDSDDD